MVDLQYNPFIVGIGHKARQGKDTLAHHLHSLFPSRSKIYSFVDPLKAHLRIMGLMGQEKNGPLLQTIGTEVYRGFDPEFWINQLIYRLNDDRMPLAIVPDMRFHNEKVFCEAHGIAVRVLRYEKGGSLYIDPLRPSTHPSETELDHVPFGYTIEATSGDIAKLHREADRLASLIQRRLAAKDEDARQRHR